MNVRILKTNDFDFSFYNPLDFNYTVNITKASDNSIMIELVGYPFSTEYSVSTVEETVLSYETLYYDNDLLGATTANVIITDTVDDTIYHLLDQTGSDGKILAYVKTTTETDLTVTSEIIYRETYNSTPEIYQENIVPKVGG